MAGRVGKSLFLGSFVHSRSLDELEFWHDAAVCVSADGAIVAIERGCDLQKAEEIVFPRLGWPSEEVSVTRAQPGQFFFPGFVGWLFLFFLVF